MYSTWYPNFLNPPINSSPSLFLKKLFVKYPLPSLPDMPLIMHFLWHQVLHHGETVIYHLVELQPGRSYELRVSYPSTVSSLTNEICFVLLVNSKTLITRFDNMKQYLHIYTVGACDEETCPLTMNVACMNFFKFDVYILQSEHGSVKWIYKISYKLNCGIIYILTNERSS